MRSLISILGEKKSCKPKELDDKTVFFLFSGVLEREYGKRGLANIQPVFYKSGRLFLRAEQSIWANEVLMQKENLLSQLNDIIGNKEVVDIKISKR